jgi:hypothetical protein
MEGRKSGAAVDEVTSQALTWRALILTLEPTDSTRLEQLRYLSKALRDGPTPQHLAWALYANQRAAQQSEVAALLASASEVASLLTTASGAGKCGGWDKELKIS